MLLGEDVCFWWGRSLIPETQSRTKDRIVFIVQSSCDSDKLKPSNQGNEYLKTKKIFTWFLILHEMQSSKETDNKYAWNKSLIFGLRWWYLGLGRCLHLYIRLQVCSISPQHKAVYSACCYHVSVSDYICSSCGHYDWPKGSVLCKSFYSCHASLFSSCQFLYL